MAVEMNELDPHSSTMKNLKDIMENKRGKLLKNTNSMIAFILNLKKDKHCITQRYIQGSEIKRKSKEVIVQRLG